MTSLSHMIEDLAFNDIRRPSIQINDRLHDYRQYLAFLRRRVGLVREWIPPAVSRDLEMARETLSPGTYIGDPATRLDHILEEAKRSESFLMDSFQILMSTMTVLDSQRSLEQTQRAQTLTQLAFIYVPLSFVTGVFGMNVKEINGSALSVWVAVVTLGITVVLTALVFWSAPIITAKFKQRSHLRSKKNRNLDKMVDEVVHVTQVHPSK